MKRKKSCHPFQLVLGVFRGIIEDVHLYKDEMRARRKYHALRHKYGIRKGEEGMSDNEVKWYEIPIEEVMIHENVHRS